jgi:6-pyruvoyltetrahydropterin/6-carboxytetrahydropterin synthase
MKIQYITRMTNLSCGHRVMNERMLCFNLHGHEYITHLTFSFENSEEIGYAIDFKEIKRVFIQFLQDKMDHGMLLNPKDVSVIKTVNEIGSKLWEMSLNGLGEYCNPSVENVAKEIFLSMEIISDVLYGKAPTGLKVYKVLVYETPNCWTECISESISEKERQNFRQARLQEIYAYAQDKGIVEYDDRKITYNTN